MMKAKEIKTLFGNKCEIVIVGWINNEYIIDLVPEKLHCRRR